MILSGSKVLLNLMQITSAKSWSARGASHQPTSKTASLLVTCVCPVYLVDELVLAIYDAYNWPNGGSIDVFLRVVSVVLVPWRVGAILGKGFGIQRQNYVALLQETQMTAGLYYKNLIVGI